MEPVQVGAGALLQRVMTKLGVVGRGWQPRLYPEIYPVITIPLDETGNEQAATVEGHSFFGYAHQAAVAASFASLWLRNPATSDRTIIVDEVQLWARTIADQRAHWRILVDSPQVEATLGQNARGGAPGPVGAVQSRTNAVRSVGVTLARFVMCGLNRPEQLLPPGQFIVLPPGFALVIEEDHTGAAITANYRWREYLTSLVP